MRQICHREKMKKILYLLPLLLIILACGAQPSSTQDVSNMVNATLTAIAQNNPQVVPLQLSATQTASPISTAVQQVVQPTLSSQSPATSYAIPPKDISIKCAESWFFYF
jgi:uncharacterized lipoprotein YajG